MKLFSKLPPDGQLPYEKRAILGISPIGMILFSTGRYLGDCYMTYKKKLSKRTLRDSLFNSEPGSIRMENTTPYEGRWSLGGLSLRKQPPQGTGKTDQLPHPNVSR